LTPIIKKSKLVLWNGPLGKYEDGGDKATKKILRLVLKSKSHVVIGGGDTIALLSKISNIQYPISNKRLFVSTGGGATLEFLTKGILLGIEALE